MHVTIDRAEAIGRTLHDFSMRAALDNMSRYGSQLCLAPCEAGLLDHAHEEFHVLLAVDRGMREDACSPDTVTALRQTLKGAAISMAAGSSGGRQTDLALRDAIAELDADGVEPPCVAAFPISWRRDTFGRPRPAHGLVTRSQLDAAMRPGRDAVRQAVKAVLEARHDGKVHRMEFRELADGRIPGPIREGVARHERYFAAILGREEPEVPDDERAILRRMMEANVDRSARIRFGSGRGDGTGAIDEVAA